VAHIHLSPNDIVVSDTIMPTEEPAHALMHDASSLIEVLENHRDALPFADTELRRYRQIRCELETQQFDSEYALEQWRAALTQRWQCEVEGLRLYMHIHTFLSDQLGPESPYLQVIAPTRKGGALTAEDLLADLQRTHAALLLLSESLMGLEAYREQLQHVCSEIENAIEQTLHWEERRRSTILAQRLAQDAYERACDQIKHLVVEYSEPHIAQ
jgi:hypothetical protein